DTPAPAQSEQDEEKSKKVKKYIIIAIVVILALTIAYFIFSFLSGDDNATSESSTLELTNSLGADTSESEAPKEKEVSENLEELEEVVEELKETYAEEPTEVEEDTSPPPSLGSNSEEKVER
ncbi:MAG: hypothetical protein O3B47_05590, partial [bacterium]|nr:hypothetical protein [bacterium]